MDRAVSMPVRGSAVTTPKGDAVHTSRRLHIEFSRPANRRHTRRADETGVRAERHAIGAFGGPCLCRILRRAGRSDCPLRRQAADQPGVADIGFARSLVGNDSDLRRGAKFSPTRAGPCRRRRWRSGLHPCCTLVDCRHGSAEKRSSAIAFYGLGIPIGGLLGLIIGGIVNDLYGWRAAFMLVGAPGILLALILPRIIGDPRFSAQTAAAAGSDMPAAPPCRSTQRRAKSSRQRPISIS